jgi:hypothetical protein
MTNEFVHPVTYSLDDPAKLEQRGIRIPGRNLKDRVIAKDSFVPEDPPH